MNENLDAAAIRNKALNECAQICDEMEQHYSDYKDTALLNGDVALSNAASGEPRACRFIAERIRALATQSEPAQQELTADETNDLTIAYMSGYADGKRAAQQAGQPAPALPDNCVIVPKEPTEEMIQAGCVSQSGEKVSSYVEWRRITSSGVADRIRRYIAEDYRAMINAAPAQEGTTK